LAWASQAVKHERKTALKKRRRRGGQLRLRPGSELGIPGGRQLLVSGARPFPSQHFIRAERRPRDLQLVPVAPGPTGKQTPESTLP
jgi:hypothetical protein